MLVVIRKVFAISVVILIVLTTGAWKSNQVHPVPGAATGQVEIPLYPGVAWSNPDRLTQNIRININGASVSLLGRRYEALEQFPFQIPQEMSAYYSNEHLAKSGWESYDSFEDYDGTYKVFYHESGLYLMVKFLSVQTFQPAFVLLFG